MTFTLCTWSCITLLSIAAAFPAHAQAVNGMVVNELTRRPVFGARLALVDETGRQVIAQTVADSAEAVFHLDAPGPGHYRLRITQGRGGIVFSPRFTLDSGQVLEQLFAVPTLPPTMLEAYPADEVTRVAAVEREQDAPVYPQRQRKADVAGVVRVLVVVDAKGRPKMDTFRVLESPHEDFSRAVERAVRRWRFVPAERNGVTVAQVKPLAFDFGFGFRPSVLPDEEGVVVIRALDVMRIP